VVGVDGDAWVGKKEGVMCKVRAGCRFGVVWDVGRSRMTGLGTAYFRLRR
jgi:hypothetical protein